MQFNVECKWISVDIARKIHREDSYKFAQELIPKIEQRNYSGKIDIILEDRLKSGSVNQLCAEVLAVIDSGVLQGDCEIGSFGSLDLDLSSVSGVVVDINACMKELCERKADKAQGTIFARSDGGKPVDPIELTVMSKKADTVLDGIKEKAKGQCLNT